MNVYMVIICHCVILFFVTNACLTLPYYIIGLFIKFQISVIVGNDTTTFFTSPQSSKKKILNSREGE